MCGKGEVPEFTYIVLQVVEFTFIVTADAYLPLNGRNTLKRGLRNKKILELYCQLLGSLAREAKKSSEFNFKSLL